MTVGGTMSRPGKDIWRDLETCMHSTAKEIRAADLIGIEVSANMIAYFAKELAEAAREMRKSAANEEAAR